MKKTVAIGLAGVTAVVIAAWRQVQRDNTMPDDVAVAPGVPVDPLAPTPDVTKAPSVVDEKTSKADLYEVAQDLDIEGRSKMTKTELLEAIRKAS